MPNGPTNKSIDDVSSVFSGHPSARLGKYLLEACQELKILSIFDELKYDRADADIVSVGMRNHAIKQLDAFGFRQVSGTVLENKGQGVRCHIPKFHALGASPFDSVRYVKRAKHDYVMLTPTQTACQFIDYHPHAVAIERIKVLIERQPVNLLRIVDFLERKPKHDEFRHAVGHLKYSQRVAVETEPLRSFRGLG